MYNLGAKSFSDQLIKLQLELLKFGKCFLER